MSRQLNKYLFLLFPVVLFLSSKAMSEENLMGAFAIGRGGAAATEAVNVQHRLRLLVGTTGSIKQVDLQRLLSAGEQTERQLAQAEAIEILKKAKRAYDELELEDAQSKFQLALKKFEYGYGYLKDPGYMIETMMFLGASLVLAGEPEKGLAVFRRVALMPGQKKLNEDLFPPNIQEVFSKAKAEVQATHPSRIKILSKPYGAEIQIDEVYKGASPLTIADIRPGIHMVRATKDGFMPWGGKIKVRPGKENKFRLSPKPLAKRKAYSSHFGRMSAELIRGEPGLRTEKFCKFLGVDRLVIAVMDGEPSSMSIRAYSVAIVPEMTFTQHKDTFDIDDPQYSTRLKEFLLKLIESGDSSEDASDGDDEGAKESAKLVAGSKGDEDSDGESFGLDLSDSSSGETEVSENTTKQRSTDSDLANEQKTEDKQKTKDEQKDDKSAEADKVVQDAAETKPGMEHKDDADQQFAFTWTYLHDKWWFWTSVGVLAAGAATGTYFAITAGSEEGGGTLVLGLH